MKGGCRELAGVLFKHACPEAGDARCDRCDKPVCARHRRELSGQLVCISCLRRDVEAREDRGSIAWLRDDPYFYWYSSPFPADPEPYTREDYALFDEREAPDERGDDDGWEGS